MALFVSKVSKFNLNSSIISGLNIFSSYSTFPLSRSLKETDPETFTFIQGEELRQKEGIELIASENFASLAVREALGSCFTNKYSEGYPNARYYAGNEFIDKNELLCQKRALEVYRLEDSKWGVNVQPLSGSPANMEAYSAVLNPHDRIMGLELAGGGHLTHGFMTQKKRVSATSVFFESMPYGLRPDGFIDYDEMETLATRFLPKLIIAGVSAYSRDIDYARIRKICDKVGAYLLADMAHISGLVAAGATKTNPFDYADIVTTTTHKSLRGPRGGMIFFRKGVQSVNAKTGQETLYDLEEKINGSVFPSFQGGPHNNAIAALSVALKEANTQEFRDYIDQVKKNASHFANKMVEKGYKIVSGGTDNHLFLLDLSPKGVDGSRTDKVLEKCAITVNKNTIPGDTKPLIPSGIRIGTPAMTTRGLIEKDFDQVAEFCDRGINLTVEISKKGNAGKSLKAFGEVLKEENKGIITLKKEVEDWAKQFPIP